MNSANTILRTGVIPAAYMHIKYGIITSRLQGIMTVGTWYEPLVYYVMNTYAEACYVCVVV